jgi:hypothetical protein
MYFFPSFSIVVVFVTLLSYPVIKLSKTDQVEFAIVKGLVINPGISVGVSFGARASTIWAI